MGGTQRWEYELRHHLGTGIETTDLARGVVVPAGLIRECSKCPISHFDGYILRATYLARRRAVFWHVVTALDHAVAVAGMNQAVSRTAPPTQYE